MAKKSKLICTIILLMFIAIMIPVAIFASNGIGASITNMVTFNVSDIEGKFLYAVKGNAKPEIHDIGYINEEIQPERLFYGAILDGSYKILDSSGEPVTAEQQMTVPSNGILFDETHLTVEYYFIFLNTAVNESDPSLNDNRSINVSVSGINNLNAYNVNAGWSYITKTTDNKEDLLSPLDESGDWTYENNSETYLLSTDKGGVDVPPENGGLYSYLIMKYTLALTNVKASFTTDLILTIHLEGYTT